MLFLSFFLVFIFDLFLKLFFVLSVLFLIHSFIYFLRGVWRTRMWAKLVLLIVVHSSFFFFFFAAFFFAFFFSFFILSILILVLIYSYLLILIHQVALLFLETRLFFPKCFVVLQYFGFESKCFRGEARGNHRLRKHRKWINLACFRFGKKSSFWADCFWENVFLEQRQQVSQVGVAIIDEVVSPITSAVSK